MKRLLLAAVLVGGCASHPSLMVSKHATFSGPRVVSVSGWNDDQVVLRRMLQRWRFSTTKEQSRFSIEMEGTCNSWVAGAGYGDAVPFQATLYDQGQMVAFARVDGSEECPEGPIARLGAALAARWSDDEFEHASEN